MLVFYSTRKFNEDVHNRLLSSIESPSTKLEYIENNGVSLTEVYNTVLNSTDEEIIVFIHDDIHLQKGWDECVKKNFETSDYGILGVAGTTELGADGCWWTNKTKMLGQVWHKEPKTNKWVLSTYCPKHEFVMNSILVDGLFIAVHKNRIKHKFDERIKGFHFYDISFCIANHQQGVKIGVITQFDVKHESVGAVGVEWNKNRLVFTMLYKDYLPTSVIGVIPTMNLPKPYKVSTPPLKTLTKVIEVNTIIPTKNNFETLKKCLTSLDKTINRVLVQRDKEMPAYQIFIHVADTGSSVEIIQQTESLLNELNANGKATYLLQKFNYYNFAKINNEVVKSIGKKGDLLVFCNDDIEFGDDDVIGEMVYVYKHNEKTVGTIGCRLMFPNGTIQHGGVVVWNVDQHRVACHHYGYGTYFGASTNLEYVPANTGALLCVPRELFYNVGMFNTQYTTCFEDVELNLKLLASNRRNIYLGYVSATHHESVSRKKDANKQQMEASDFRKLYPYLQRMMPHIRNTIRYGINNTNLYP